MNQRRVMLDDRGQERHKSGRCGFVERSQRVSICNGLD
jgi:hypothetical protein